MGKAPVELGGLGNSDPSFNVGFLQHLFPVELALVIVHN